MEKKEHALVETLEGISLVVLALSLSAPQQKLLGHLDGLVGDRELAERTLSTIRSLVPGYLPGSSG